MSKIFCRLLFLFLLLSFATEVFGQWTNRYPKIANVSHHVYLEGYNLPTLNQGATDPSVSPDGKTLAIAARGWLWLMNTKTREAKRLTKSGAIDSRPAWSPDGRKIVFVRDDGKDTSIVLIDAANGSEKVLIDSPALDLDPVFSSDGRHVFYSSAESGDLDLWRIEMATGAKKRLTSDRGQELQPQPLPDDAQILYVSKVGSIDAVSLINLRDNSKRVLHSDGIASQMRFATKPDGRSFVINLPAQDRWQLWQMDTKGSPAIQLVRDAKYPLMPAWSPDNSFIYFAETDTNERFHIYRTTPTGGTPEDISPLSWDWGEQTMRVLIKTRRAGSETNLLPVRLTVIDSKGHPVLPESGVARFDGQNGNVFFYSPGVIELEMPLGEARVLATYGFGTVAQTVTRKIREGKTETIEIEMPAPLWNPTSDGWYSADLHLHLNYGGPYLLTPEDIILDMRGEALDLSTPQLANLHTRFIDTEWWNWRRTELPMIVFAQEVRSHFLGHIGIVGADSLFHPWYSGPGYPIYDDIDLPNSAALQFARSHGGVNSYVHPVSTKDPFPVNAAPNGLPLELVPDAVLGDVDTLEVTCLWSDELGTSEAWYRLLNLGIPIAPSAGSDTMHNFYRTMAIGATRIYAKPDGAMNLPNYLEAVRRGRSFVTNGPLLKFSAGDAEAGGIINAAANQSIDWKLEAASSSPVEKVEILVNGKVAWSGQGLSAAGRKTFAGKINAPAGGWIAARVYGGATQPPMSDSYPFAHTAPIWFGRVGSSDAAAAKASAQDLLRWMDVADKRVEQGYTGAKVDNLKKRFSEARRILKSRAK
jgi:TolB protein